MTTSNKRDAEEKLSIHFVPEDRAFADTAKNIASHPSPQEINYTIYIEVNEGKLEQLFIGPDSDLTDYLNDDFFFDECVDYTKDFPVDMTGIFKIDVVIRCFGRRNGYPDEQFSFPTYSQVHEVPDTYWNVW